MTLPPHLRAVLPADTQLAWTRLGPLVPRAAYLVGGTGLAAHLGHRTSRDLDFFLERAMDVEALEASLVRAGTLLVTGRAPGTLHCVLGRTRLQFFDASDQHRVEPTVTIGGLRVAGLGDLLATKLKVIVDRPALRDYVDLRAIEERAHRYVEEGLAIFILRYRPAAPDQAVAAVVRALASFEDVPEDPGLGVSVRETARYWTRRVRAVVAHLDRSGLPPSP